MLKDQEIFYTNHVCWAQRQRKSLMAARELQQGLAYAGVGGALFTLHINAQTGSTRKH